MQEGLLGSQFACLQFILAGKAWWQELGKSHTVSAAQRQKEMNAGAQHLPIFFFNARTPVYGMVLFTFR